MAAQTIMSEGIVVIDTPHKPSDAVRFRAEIEKRRRRRYMQMNVANLYDFVTGAGSHGRA